MFDVEIALLIPLGLINKFISIITINLICFIIIFILIWGLFFEWNQNILEWTWNYSLV